MTQSISDDTPNGFCKTCGYPLLNGAGHTRVCVNCSTHSEPSGLVNNEKDPGHAATVKQLGTMLKPNEVKAIAPDGNSLTKVVIPDRPIVPVYISNPIGTVQEALTFLRKNFESLPVTDLKQAKDLLKLRKEIDSLANKITNFLGGN